MMRSLPLLLFAVVFFSANCATADTSGRRPKATDHYKLAERYYHAGDFDRAEEQCKMVLRFDPRNSAASALLADIQLIKDYVKLLRITSARSMGYSRKRK